MKQRINIAELLKNCPEGMELYTPLFGSCTFVKVRDNDLIVVRLENDVTRTFLSDGRYYDYPDAECLLFPKGKRTWKGFVPPCNSNDGDVLAIVVIVDGKKTFLFKKGLWH